MLVRRLLPSLCGLTLLSVLGAGAALAQGHGTPNAPEAGPAAPGTESSTGQGDQSPAGEARRGTATDSGAPLPTEGDKDKRANERNR